MRKVTKSADGTKGILIWSGETFYFRVYAEDFTFVDYDILHSDLSITIDDTDAYFYKANDGADLLDHSPETLGYPVEKTNADPSEDN